MPEYISLDRYREVARELSYLQDVEQPRVETDHPDVETCILARIGPNYERVPPCVHRAIANYDLGTRPDLSCASGEYWQLVIV